MMSTLLLWSVLGCEDAPVTRTSPAVPLGLVSRELASDLEDQALDVLGRDARRREARFRDAVEPGYLFRSTRVAQLEIDAGLWSPGDLFELGGQLFSLTPTVEQGFGGADTPGLRRFHLGQRGGPDATSCVGCHWRGGPAGGGDGADNAYLDGDGLRQSSALARNPPALVGLGARERLAAEMSADLQRIRDELLALARRSDQPLRADLVSKGVSFGWLGALPDGALDLRGIEGVSEDLIIRPFGWKGHFATIRDAAEDELALHLGLQSTRLAATGDPARVGAAPRPDPDGDGVVEEISEGQLTALTVFLALQELPIVHLPTRQDWLGLWSKGEGLFGTVGCASCHVPTLTLDDTAFALDAREGDAQLVIDLMAEGMEPRLSRDADGRVSVYVYSDFKRHDMGPELAEARPSHGVEAALFMTPPLWGLARTRPYLHDGRAASVDLAILAHGGEAAASRRAYAALPIEDQHALRLFLSTLNRAPRLISP